MGSAKKLVKAVAIGALIVVAAPVVGAALVGGTVSATVATAVGAGVITGGITAVQGGSPSDVLRSAVIGGVTAGLGATAANSVSASVAEAAREAGYADIAASMAKVAGGVTQGGVSSASRSVITGQGDPLEALLQGGISGGLGAGVMEGVNTATSNIDGFAKYDNATGKFTGQEGDIPMAVQRATKAALATGALGGDMTAAAQNSMLQTVSKYAGDQIKDYGTSLKTSYDKYQASTKAITDNQTAQQKAIDDYAAKAKEVNDKNAAIQTKTDEFNAAKAEWEKSKGTTEEKNKLAETANKLAGEANALIKEYNAYRPEADKELAGYKDTLTTLQTDIKKLDETALSDKDVLTASLDEFQKGEAANAAKLAQMVKDAETAKVTAKNDLGIDLTEEQLARAIQSGNIGEETGKIIAETNQASIDLGYENYKDQTAAKANGIEDAKQWANYKDTSGIVDSGADVNQVALGGQGKTTELFEPEAPAQPSYDYGGDYSAGLDEGDMFPSDYAGDTTDTTVADANLADTTVANTAGTNLADTAALDTSGPETFAAEDTLTPYSDTADVDLASILDETPYDVGAQDTTEVPPDLQAQLDDLGLDIKDLGVDNIAAMTQGPSVSEAMVAPSGGSYDLLSSRQMSDSDLPTSAGLSSLISQQEGGTSATADDAGIKSITENNLGTDQTAGTDYGSAAYNALTGADTSRTIAENTLGSDKGDVTGGVGTEGLYSGKESEITPSDTVTNRAFSKAPQTSALAESIVTDAEARKAKEEAPTQGATEAVLQAGDTSQDAKLFKSNDVTPTEAVTEGKKMEDDFDTAWNNAQTDFMVPTNELPPGSAGGAAPDSWEAFDKATNDYMDDRKQNGFMIDSTTKAYPNDDGSYRMVNLETGQESTASWDQMQKMMGGQGFGAGESAGLRGPAQTPPGWGTKFLNAAAAGTTAALSNPKMLAALGGAALGAASAKQATGITPHGLRSLQSATGKTMSQTGAKGTGGKGSVRYFEKKAGGGEIGKGGLGYLKSAHDGMADKINATIDNKRPAKLSGGEFVIPADVVSHLGNGNSEAGAQQLYALMERVRKARTGNSEQGKQINPKKYLPK